MRKLLESSVKRVKVIHTIQKDVLNNFSKKTTRKAKNQVHVRKFMLNNKSLDLNPRIWQRKKKLSVIK